MVHVATPDETTWLAQPVILVPPDLKLTVPVAPAGTAAVNVTIDPRFTGERGSALNVVVVDVNEGNVAAVLLAEGPVPPALHAATLNV